MNTNPRASYPPAGSSYPSGISVAPLSGPRSSAPSDRVAQLKKEFVELDADKNGFISLEELIQFMNKKTNGQGDVQLCTTIFNALDKDGDRRVSIDEFVNAYVEKEEDLKRQIATLKSQLAEKQRQKQVAVQNVRESGTQEKMNAYGIMEGSQLTATVMEANGLLPTTEGVPVNPFVLLVCERQQIETKVAWKEASPLWNEAFTFNITQGHSDLSVIVMNKDQYTKDELIGQVSVPLSDLKDQLKHDQWYPLLKANEPKDKARGQIRLGLQWIHSKVQYLETVVNQWEEVIIRDQGEINALQRELENLQKPFGVLDASVWVQREREFSTLLETYAATHLKLTNWQKLSSALLITYLVVATFGMFARPDFMNVGIACYAYYNFSGNKWTKDKYFVLLMCLLISEFMDIIWMSIYFQAWRSEGAGYFKMNKTSPEDSVKTFSIVCTLLNFFLKLITCLVVGKNYVDLKHGKPIQTNAPIPPTAAGMSMAPRAGLGMGARPMSSYPSA